MNASGDVETIDHEATYFTSTRDNLELLELFEQNIYIHASRIFADSERAELHLPSIFPSIGRAWKDRETGVSHST